MTYFGNNRRACYDIITSLLKRPQFFVFRSEIKHVKGSEICDPIFSSSSLSFFLPFSLFFLVFSLQNILRNWHSAGHHSSQKLLDKGLPSSHQASVLAWQMLGGCLVDLLDRCLVVAWQMLGIYLTDALCRLTDSGVAFVHSVTILSSPYPTKMLCTAWKMLDGMHASSGLTGSTKRMGVLVNRTEQNWWTAPRSGWTMSPRSRKSGPAPYGKFTQQ